MGIGALDALNLVDGTDLRPAEYQSDAVDLAGAQRRQAGGLLRHHQHLHLVDVGKLVAVLLVAAPVAGVLGVGPGAARHQVDKLERAGADQVLPVAHVAVLLDHLRREHEADLVGDHLLDAVQLRLAEVEQDGAVIDRGDRLQGGNAAGEVGGRLGEAATVAEVAVIVEYHVPGGELAPVHRRLVVPVHVVAKNDLERGGARLVPALGQKRLLQPPWEIGGAEVVLAAVKPPVGVAQFLHDAAGHNPRIVILERVEGRRVAPARVGQRAAVLRRQHHLSGSGVLHHHPVRRHRRSRFALAGGPGAGRAQAENQQGRQPSLAQSRSLHGSLLSCRRMRVADG